MADAPRRSVAVVALFAAAYAPDIADTLYWLLRVCSPYGLYSHTVPAVGPMAAAIGGAAWLITGSPKITALFVLAVVLHVPADYLTGFKLLFPGAEYFSGYHLYDWPVRDILVELPIILGGWWLLRRSQQGPRWMRSGLILVPAVTLQVLFAYFHTARGVNLKPGVCFNAPAASTALR